MQQVNGESQFWGCQNSVTPEPIDKKFDTHDYISELTSYAKFHKFGGTRAIRQYGEMYTSHTLYGFAKRNADQSDHNFRPYAHSKSKQPKYKSQCHKSCMMNMQIRVKKLLVQLNVLLLVVQWKFNPSKRKIVCLANKFSYLFGRCCCLRSVMLSCSSNL